MSAADHDDQGSFGGRFKRWRAAVAGRLGLAAPSREASVPEAAPPPANDYRSSGDAPAAWLQFAIAAQSGLQGRLSEEDEQAEEVHRLFRAHDAAGDRPGGVVKASVWITATGKVSRLEFDEVHETLASALRNVLSGFPIGAPPPGDMLQPIRLRLWLGTG